MDINAVECRHGLRMRSCRTCNKQDLPPVRRQSATEMRQGMGRRSPLNSGSYFGHSWDEWFEMQSAGKHFLESCARERRLPEYEDLWIAVRQGVGRDIGSAWRQVPQLLRHISEESLKENRLALTAIVVSGGASGGPSEGFFTLAVREGLLEESEAPAKGVKWTGMSKRQRSFWLEHVQQIFDFYG